MENHEFPAGLTGGFFQAVTAPWFPDRPFRLVSMKLERRPHPEWVLMADRGVPLSVIARLNDVNPKYVRDYVTRRGEALRGGPAPSPLVLHDRPRPRPARLPDPDRRWRARLSEFEAFLATHQRRPHISRKATDRSMGTEWALSHWLTTQRAADRAGALAEHRARALDRVLPSWRMDDRAIEYEAQWRLRLVELVSFAALAGRYPQHRDRPQHAGLVSWLAAQRLAARQGMLDQSREWWLDRQVPGWRARHET